MIALAEIGIKLGINLYTVVNVSLLFSLDIPRSKIYMLIIYLLRSKILNVTRKAINTNCLRS